MDDTREVLDALCEPFPAHAIEYREGGGGKQLAYVATETVIRRLNRVAGAWDFKMTGHEWRDPIEFTDKNGNAKRSQVLVIYGELTIPGLGTRSGTGVQAVDPDARSSEDVIKGGMSDCLKKCATLFGVGIDLYGPDLEAGELPTTPNLPARARTTSVNTIPGDNPNGNGITDKQIGLIRLLAEQKGVEPETVRSMHGRESARSLTRAEASTLIDQLQAL